MDRLFICVRNNKRDLVINSSFSFINTLVYSYISNVFVSFIDSKTYLSLLLNNLLELKEDISIFKCY
ncbi:hypothetical protein SAMN02745163_04174 [Clostridium cavendishii DSM 21758]|uniref:Uncharacterized protein n=1 Tax=Clostridium cavendishii DSM 21758 TaxID=1121302 RepID=A0A1M6U4V1_9CLOT|nr:hypothetical protein [Clostridium cavendishii]SHK64194.1 hypothetical protein SAMN02745163_04174 [Clostridium cavendishii DSM 21758]